MLLASIKNTTIENPLTKDLDFDGFKAVAMACDSGTSLPSTPTTGQWFLFKATGRSWLVQYDGSAWRKIMAFGTTTIYVDGTLGTDGTSYGTGTGADANKTNQYAWNQVPGIIETALLIYVASGTYAASLTLSNKVVLSSTGSIHLYGTLEEDASATADNIVQGTGYVQAAIYDAGAFAGQDYTHQLAYITSNDEYRIIDAHGWKLGFDSGSHEPLDGEFIKGQTSGAWGIIVEVTKSAGDWGAGTASGYLTINKVYGTFQDNELLDIMTNSTTVATADFATVDVAAGNARDDDWLILVATLSSAPATNAYKIYDWGTIGITTINSRNQKSLYLHYIKMNGSILAAPFTDLSLYQCSVGRVYSIQMSMVSEYDCIHVVAANVCVDSFQVTAFTVQRTKCYATGASNIARAMLLGQIYFVNGSIVHGDRTAGSIGLLTQQLSALSTAAVAADGYVQVRCCQYGSYAYAGGQISNTSSNGYMGNTTADETSVAASYGYVD